MTEGAKDNRHLSLRGEQELTDQEILQLKSETAFRSDLVKQLAEKSASFQHKTKFSQEKYLKRKAKKYTSLS